MLCWSLALCATGSALFVSRRYRRLCVRFAPPPDLSLLHFTLLHQRTHAGNALMAFIPLIWRRLLRACVLRTAPLPPQAHKNTTHTVPLAKCLASSVQLASPLIYPLRHLLLFFLRKKHKNNRKIYLVVQICVVLQHNLYYNM